MDANHDPRVVLVHDWLTGMRGGEKCLEVLCRRWPHARLLSLLHRPGSVSAAIESLQPRTSFLQLLPAVHRYYRYLLPLMPAAVRNWRLPQCDLVVSFSHCVAKGVRVPPGVPHVCYCFTPMRYAWHLREAYFANRGSKIEDGGSKEDNPPSSILHPPSSILHLRSSILDWIRAWDKRTADGVTHFLAISRTVQRRIAECYDRPSTVLYPPVDTDYYCPAPVARGDYYLAVSAFAPYKRLDLAVEACGRLGRRLVVIGSGQDEARVRGLAGPTVRFLGWQPDEVIRDHLRRCRALLFPGEEDFGIVPVEAMACGAPVIALGRGGATETVVPFEAGRRRWDATGMFFEEQSVEGLCAALEQFEANADRFSPEAARRQAERFNRQRFAEELFAYLDGVLDRTALPLRRAA